LHYDVFNPFILLVIAGLRVLDEWSEKYSGHINHVKSLWRKTDFFKNNSNWEHHVNCTGPMLAVKPWCWLQLDCLLLKRKKHQFT